MPQMVALLNGFGGGASLLVAGGTLHSGATTQMQALIATALSGLIGAVTFWGSLVAYAKLEEFERDLHRHVHLENNLIFPKAKEMEQALRSQ